MILHLQDKSDTTAEEKIVKFIYTIIILPFG